MWQAIASMALDYWMQQKAREDAAQQNRENFSMEKMEKNKSTPRAHEVLPSQPRGELSSMSRHVGASGTGPGAGGGANVIEGIGNKQAAIDLMSRQRPSGAASKDMNAMSKTGTGAYQTSTAVAEDTPPPADTAATETPSDFDNFMDKAQGYMGMIQTAKSMSDPGPPPNPGPVQVGAGTYQPMASRRGSGQLLSGSQDPRRRRRSSSVLADYWRA